MATYAVIENNAVTNIIVADTKETAEEATGLSCVEYSEDKPAGIGWEYDGVDFIAPAIEPAAEPVVD